MHYPTDMTAHTMAFVTPVGEYWLEVDTGFRSHNDSLNIHWVGVRPLH